MLATLDGSTYEEMLRQQLITVEQAKASHLQAQLNHEIALLAVHEYSDGTVQETIKGMEGTIALARSDLSRAQDHLTWTKRMSEKGYASAATDRLGEAHRCPVGAGAGAASSQRWSSSNDSRCRRPKRTFKDRSNPRKPAWETKRSAFNGNSNDSSCCKSKSTGAPFVRLTTVSCSTTSSPIPAVNRQRLMKAWRSGNDSRFSICRTCRKWRFKPLLTSRSSIESFQASVYPSLSRPSPNSL